MMASSVKTFGDNQTSRMLSEHNVSVGVISLLSVSEDRRAPFVFTPSYRLTADVARKSDCYTYAVIGHSGIDNAL